MADAMKLLPCPFCGEDAQVSRRMGYAFSFCGKCHAEGPTSREDADHAAKAWNRRASPPAREEVPAEGAMDTVEEVATIIDAWPFSQQCRSDSTKRDSGKARRVEALFKARAILSALRNRTSEPEAREGEVVAWERYGTSGSAPCWVPVDPEDIEHYRGKGQMVRALFTHPAPSESDDRLRVAVEALERADAAARSAAAMCAADYRVDPEKLGETIYKITAPALASLQEGGGQ